MREFTMLPTIDGNYRIIKCTLIFLSVIEAFRYACPSGEELPLGGPVGACPTDDCKRPCFLLDLKNKFAYYECANGEPYLQYCKGGLVFNPRKSICDYPNSDCEPYGPVGICPESPGKLPLFLRDGVVESVFYMCVNGCPKKLKCGGTMVFDPYKEACVL